MKDGDRYGINSVNRAIAVLEVCALNGPLPQAVIARQTGLTDATALRYLSTLARHGFVERDPTTGFYRLGLRLFQLGQRVFGERDPRQVARPVMERLLTRFDETLNLAMRRGDVLVLIDALESRRTIKRGASVGGQDPWHSSSLGKAILAHLPESEVDELLELHPLERLTAATLVERDLLARELARVRETGYAVDDEECEDGLRCVGAPIFDRDGRPTLALSISGPASRFTPAAVVTMGEAIREAADEIGRALGFAQAVPETDA
jgi:IclR family acetate operon transcriptional repressor